MYFSGAHYIVDRGAALSNPRSILQNDFDHIAIMKLG